MLGVCLCVCVCVYLYDKLPPCSFLTLFFQVFIKKIKLTMNGFTNYCWDYFLFSKFQMTSIYIALGVTSVWIQVPRCNRSPCLGHGWYTRLDISVFFYQRKCIHPPQIILSWSVPLPFQSQDSIPFLNSLHLNSPFHEYEYVFLPT